MIELLKGYYPDFQSIQESPLKRGDHIYGWQVTALDDKSIPVGSGFAKDLASARKIAVAEFIERRFVQDARKLAPQIWLLNEFPTSCGFAAGYDYINTKVRSVGEAIERWALSRWFDFNNPLDTASINETPEEYKILLSEFDDVAVFKKSFLVNLEANLVSFELCLFVGFKDTGCFMGCAVRNTFNEAIGHSIIEAHRHLLISQQNRDFEIFPFNRIKYFSQNKDAALDILSRKRTEPWPSPRIKFQHDYHNELFFITRTILNDWTPWEKGPTCRMLY